MSTDYNIKAIAPWFGSKRNLAPEIIAELGEHRSFWEPFCGGLSILLAKSRSSMETVNDLHSDLVNLARVVQDPSMCSMLYRRLKRTLMSRDLHQLAAEIVREPFDPSCDRVERAWAYFVAMWIGRNGVAGTSGYNFGFCSRYTHKGGHSATRFRAAIRSLIGWRKRLEMVTIESVDGFEFLSRIEDAPGAAIYCDPPYIEKGAKYVHDFESADHQRLADELCRFRSARVVVSYYDHPRLTELYPTDQWTHRKMKSPRPWPIREPGATTLPRPSKCC